MRYFLLFALIAISTASFPQCEVRNKLSANGTMLYFMEPVVFYWTKTMELKGNVVTDGENYFLGFQPVPFPEKSVGKKLKGDIELKLANDRVYRLPHYDTHYLEKDSILELFYIIDNQDLKDLVDYEAAEVRIDMQGDEGVRTYVFKLHKNAIQEQLACFSEQARG